MISRSLASRFRARRCIFPLMFGRCCELSLRDQFAKSGLSIVNAGGDFTPAVSGPLKWAPGSRGFIRHSKAQ